MTEAEDITQLRRIRAQEGQLLGGEMTIVSEMRNAVYNASTAANSGDMGNSIAYLRQILAMFPNLMSLEAGVARDEALTAAEGARVGAEDTQAAQAGIQEKKLDAREIQVLKDILRRLVDINNKEIKQGRGATAQVRPEVVADIQGINQDLSLLVKLQRLELSTEVKEEMLKGEKNQAIIDLIKQERQFFGLLTQYITTIEQLLQRNGNPMTIQMYVRRAIDLINKLIAINSMEMRRT